jgi:hypothetical protein
VQPVSMSSDGAKNGTRKTSALYYTKASRPTPFLDASRHRGEETKARFSRASTLQRYFGCLLALGLIVSGLRANAVTLGWNAVTNLPIAGYRVYRGNSTQRYSWSTNVGNLTQTTVSGLTNGVTYYFAVTALTPSGVEGDYSAEIVYTPSSVTNSPSVIQLTSPAGGSLFTEPASIPLSASVIANGHAVTKVQFYN